MLPIVATLLASYAITSFVLLRKPHWIHAKKSFPFRAQHISHRGGAGENVENTLQAFESAVRSGTQMIELDCRLTKDGQVVVFHDDALDRCTGFVGSISQCDFAALPRYSRRLNVHFEPGHICDRSDAPSQPIVLLRDVFDHFPEVPINIDVKVNDNCLIYQISNLIGEYKREKLTVWGGMTRVVSNRCKQVNPQLLTYPPAEHILGYILAYHVGLLPFIPIPYDCFELPLFPALRSKGIILGPCGDSWLVRAILRVLEFLTTSAGFYRHLRRRGIPVFAWVANSDGDFQMAFDLGASGVMTDFPSRLRAFLDANPQLRTSQH